MLPSQQLQSWIQLRSYQEEPWQRVLAPTPRLPSAMAGLLYKEASKELVLTGTSWVKKNKKWPDITSLATLCRHFSTRWSMRLSLLPVAEQLPTFSVLLWWIQIDHASSLPVLGLHTHGNRQQDGNTLDSSRPLYKHQSVPRTACISGPLPLQSSLPKAL